MDLDEIDPARWALLEAATDQYIAEEDAAFDACARLLVHNVVDHARRPADIHLLALGAPLYKPNAFAEEGNTFKRISETCLVNSRRSLRCLYTVACPVNSKHQKKTRSFS